MRHAPRPATVVLLAVLGLLGPLPLTPHDVDAQIVRGRVLDASNGRPVHLAGVWLLDRDREHVDLAMADSLGRYFLTVPDSAEYFIFTERFGYFETESPLLAISNTRDYDLDIEVRPEPIGLAGLQVTVQNERVINWLRLEFGRNPSEFFGFRLLQGERLQEAKTRARFQPVETLRFLYIPVSRGSCVSLNAYPRPRSVSAWSGARRSMFEPGAPAGTRSPDSGAGDGAAGSCGGLWVDDRPIPNEQIDRIDMSTIAVIVTLPGSVRMYTYNFDWSFRRN